MTDPDRPQPVLNASKLGGLVSAAFVAVGGAYLTITQGITAKNLSAVGLAVEGAVTAVVALAVYATAVIHGRHAVAQVTPLSDPRDDTMRPLVVHPAVYGEHAAPADPDVDWLVSLHIPWEQLGPWLDREHVFSHDEAAAKAALQALRDKTA